MAKKRPPIKYTDRDFESIKNSLVEHARRYYPDTFQDFSEASFDIIKIKYSLVAYATKKGVLSVIKRFFILLLYI